MDLSVKHKLITDKAKKGRSLFAYSVYTDMDGDLKIASSWTLKDAIELFCQTQGYDKSCIRLKRPFIAQKSHTSPIYTSELC